MYNDKGPWTFRIFVIGSILSEYPSKALRHYLPLSKLTTHRLEVATQVSSTTFTKHFSWYSVWKYRLCVVVLCSTHAKVKHKKTQNIYKEEGVRNNAVRPTFQMRLAVGAKTPNFGNQSLKYLKARKRAPLRWKWNLKNAPHAYIPLCGKSFLQKVLPSKKKRNLSFSCVPLSLCKD